MEKIYSHRILERTDSDFLANMYTFLKANCTWHATDDSNYILYVTDGIYLKLVSDDYSFRVDLKDTSTGAAWLNSRTCYSSSNTYFNATIFKVNDDCFGIAFNSGDGSVTYYEFCQIVIDSYTVDDTKSKMALTQNGSSRYIADGKTSNDNIYSPYTGVGSYNSYYESYPTAQIAPFVSPYGGQTADNLYTILLTNQTNHIVTLNETEQWLFTGGFALPCGDEVTETYYEEE